MSYLKDYYNLFLFFGWIIAIGGHFYLVPSAKIPLLIAFADPFVHGLIAVLVTWVFYAKDIISLRELLVCLIAAVLIDIDHGIAAKSFHLGEWLKLPERPVSHSILFAILLSILISFFFKRSRMPLLVPIMSLALISHVTRDATDGCPTPWNFPFNPVKIDVYVYFCTFILISFSNSFLIDKIILITTKHSHSMPS